MQEVNFPIEFIIADDCSPDCTSDIVNSYINGHPKGNWIKYTRHETNKGMIPNFVWALKQAKGEFIAICEGDDYWTDPNKIRMQLSLLIDNDMFIATCHKVKLINEHKVQIGCQPEINGNNQYVFDDLIKGWFIPTASIFFRNKVNQISIDVYQNIISGDRLLTALLSNLGDFFYLDREMGVYRKHAGGISSYGNKLEIFESNIDLFKQLMKCLPLKRRQKLREQEFYWKVRRIEVLKENGRRIRAKSKNLMLFLDVKTVNELKTVIKLFFVEGI